MGIDDFVYLRPARDGSIQRSEEIANTFPVSRKSRRRFARRSRLLNEGSPSISDVAPPLFQFGDRFDGIPRLRNGLLPILPPRSAGHLNESPSFIGAGDSGSWNRRLHVPRRFRRPDQGFEVFLVFLHARLERIPTRPATLPVSRRTENLPPTVDSPNRSVPVPLDQLVMLMLETLQCIESVAYNAMHRLVPTARGVFPARRDGFRPNLPDHRDPGLHIPQAGDGRSNSPSSIRRRRSGRRGQDKVGNHNKRVRGERMIVAEFRQAGGSGARYLRVIKERSERGDGLQARDGGSAHAGIGIGPGRFFEDRLFGIVEREQRIAPLCRIRVRRLRLAFEEVSTAWLDVIPDTSRMFSYTECASHRRAAVGAVLASAEEHGAAGLCVVTYWREFAACVRPVAERLIAALSARAPEVLDSSFDFDRGTAPFAQCSAPPWCPAPVYL